MPDIRMCGDASCPRRGACYRFTATPSEFMQAWFLGTPRDVATDECSYYWPTGDNNRVLGLRIPAAEASERGRKR